MFKRLWYFFRFDLAAWIAPPGTVVVRRGEITAAMATARAEEWDE